MKELYLFSGLGADKRLFDFLDLEGFNKNHIEWIPPLESESIESYAGRLSKKIKTEKPILLGVSFGGLMAIEVGKLIDTEKIILISSAKTRQGIPFHFRFVGFFRLNKLIPAWMIKRVNPVIFWLFGVENESDRDLFKTMIEESDGEFLKWAMDKVVRWKNTKNPENAILIHGTSDRIMRNRNPDHSIIGGGHFMVANRADKVSHIVKALLAG